MAKETLEKYNGVKQFVVTAPKLTYVTNTGIQRTLSNGAKWKFTYADAKKHYENGKLSLVKVKPEVKPEPKENKNTKIK